MNAAKDDCSLRILHISDLHARGSRERSRFSRRLVLGKEWRENIKTVQADGRVDLVCFTGDLADRGQLDEYEDVTQFVSELLKLIELPSERLFVIPGNHDVNRSIAIESWRKLRTAAFQLNQHLSQWIFGEAKAPFGLEDADRDAVFERCSAYREWLSSIGRTELLPENSPHGRLGYRVSLDVPQLPFPIHVVGLDSAWLSGDDNDAERLWLTHDQLGQLCSTSAGEPLDGFRIALIHHPLSYLGDERDARTMLAGHIDLLLRGHVHTERFENVVEPDRSLQILAAGCLYEVNHRDQWPNSFHVIDVTLTSSGRPLSYGVRFRSWSRNGFWYDDSGIYRNTENGRLTVRLTSGPRSEIRHGAASSTVAQVEFIGTGGIPERRDLACGDMLFVGRAREMDIVFNDEVVSARHACFHADETGLHVKDIGSTNKVFVNDVEVKETVLKVGDGVRLGKKGPIIKVIYGLAATKREESYEPVTDDQ